MARAIVMFDRRRGKEVPGAFALWTLGCFAYLVHLLAAFATSYESNHESAAHQWVRHSRL